MITEYMGKALKEAVFEQEDGQWYGRLTDFPGVWSHASTREESASVLREVLEGWLLLKVRDADGDIPIIDGIDLNTIRVRAESGQPTSMILPTR